MEHWLSRTRSGPLGRADPFSSADGDLCIGGSHHMRSLLRELHDQVVPYPHWPAMISKALGCSYIAHKDQVHATTQNAP